jgi:hypothetical protein
MVTMRARLRRWLRRLRRRVTRAAHPPGTVEAIDPGIVTALDGFRG